MTVELGTAAELSAKRDSNIQGSLEWGRVSEREEARRQSGRPLSVAGANGSWEPTARAAVFRVFAFRHPLKGISARWTKPAACTRAHRAGGALSWEPAALQRSAAAEELKKVNFSILSCRFQNIPTVNTSQLSETTKPWVSEHHRMMYPRLRPPARRQRYCFTVLDNSMPATNV